MPFHNFSEHNRDGGGSPGRYGNVGGSPGRFGHRGQPPRQEPPHHEPPRHEPPRRRGGIGAGVRFFHGPIRFRFFGRPIFISTGRQIGFIVGLIALLVMSISTFATFTGLSYAKTELADYQAGYNQIVADSNDCLDLIAKAKAGEENYYITTGCFKNYLATFDTSDYSISGCCMYRYGNNSYYLRFYFIDENDNDRFADTFAIYSTKGQIQNLYEDFTVDGLKNMKKIEVAYKMENGQVINAINTDYDGSTNFERDYYQGKIESTKASIKTYKTSAGILIFIIVVIVALVILAIVKVFKTSKQKAELEMQKAKAETEQAQAEADKAKQELDEKRRYCTYCGAKIPEGETKCPNCGSTHFDIKD